MPEHSHLATYPELVHFQIIPLRGADPSLVFGHREQLGQRLSGLLQYFVPGVWPFVPHPVLSDAEKLVSKTGLCLHLVQHVRRGVYPLLFVLVEDTQLFGFVFGVHDVRLADGHLAPENAPRLLRDSVELKVCQSLGVTRIVELSPVDKERRRRGEEPLEALAFPNAPIGSHGLQLRDAAREDDQRTVLGSVEESHAA